MAQTASTAFSAAITFRVQKKVLENLRADLVFADRSYAVEGEFDAGIDALVFVDVPDLPINTTPLTEGTPPTARALSINVSSVSTQQYGDLVNVTDLAKAKAPIQIVDEAADRIQRQAAETMDQIVRDVIAAGGTTFFVGTGNSVRSDIASNETATSADLRKLRATMKKNKIRPFSDGYYRMFISPNVSYDLQSDTATGGWVDARKYTDPSDLLAGEIGRMSGFRFIEVVNAPTFSSTTTVHRSIAVGRTKAWACGDLQTLNTYHVAPGGDHTDPLSQLEQLGWKVDFGCAVLRNTYYYGMESAATSL